jgi:hypothetical protein
MGQQSICAHKERNCRLRQVVPNHLECYSRGDRKMWPFQHFADGDSNVARGLAFCHAADVSAENAAQI